MKSSSKPTSSSTTPQPSKASASTSAPSPESAAAGKITPRPAAIPPWKATALHAWRSVRRAFHKEQLISFAKTMSLVAPLTILIWVYAEREQTDLDAGVVFPIEILSNDPNRVVKLDKPADKNVVADLSGPRARLDRLREQLNPRAGTPSVPIYIDSSLSPRQYYELNTAALLSGQPLFANAGVTVASASPPRLRVYVDEVVEVEAQVKAPPEIKNLDSPPVFDPPVVKVRGPASVLTQAFGAPPEEDKYIVYADLSALPAIRTPGAHEDVSDIPLRRPAEAEGNVTFTPSRVSADLRVKRTDEELMIPSMPIWPWMPPTLQDRYKVVFEGGSPVVTNVPLIGPPEQIALLKDPKYTPRPVAMLKVTADDLPSNEVRTRELTFENLPKDVVVAAGYSQREVSFRLVERAPDD